MSLALDMKPFVLHISRKTSNVINSACDIEGSRPADVLHCYFLLWRNTLLMSSLIFLVYLTGIISLIASYIDRLLSDSWSLKNTNWIPSCINQISSHGCLHDNWCFITIIYSFLLILSTLPSFYYWLPDAPSPITRNFLSFTSYSNYICLIRFNLKK